ncbi:MAG: LUD domain-containing protein [Candidatus Aenigmarchaeota archaeon]|nr:LUD domain-containing protein [Candidatus Aenigmarchaeota archaeon]
MEKFGRLAGDKVIEKTISSLKANGMDAFVVESRREAKEKVLSILPNGTEVMTMSSTTLDAIGLSKEINESGRFTPIRKKLMSMDRKTQGREMQKLGAAPEWTIGSAHAVTQDGKVMIASNSGSQLPAYAYGADKVIWIVGTQKVVKDIEEGMERIYKYTLPLENERAKKAYGFPSFVSKMLIVNREIRPGRITIIFVKEKLGF